MEKNSLLQGKILGPLQTNEYQLRSAHPLVTEVDTTAETLVELNLNGRRIRESSHHGI